jgi:NTE family protein
VRLDFALGTRLGAAAEVYRPIGGSRWFVAPRLFTDRTSRNAYAGGNLVAEYRFGRAGAGVDVGIGTRDRIEARLGIDAAAVTGRVRVGSPLLPEADGSERVASLRFTYDGQDGPVVPSRGAFIRGQARRFLAAPHATVPDGGGLPADSPQRFWQAEADASWFHRVRGQDRLFVRAAGGTSFDAAPLFNGFSLGGPFRMGAFNSDELRGAHYALAGGGYLKDMGRLPAVMGRHLFAAAWVEGGSAFDRRAGAVWHTNVSAGIIADSALGPVFLGGSVGADGHYRLYIALGPFFR